MAEAAIADKPAIEKVQKSFWRCLDRHLHRTRDAALVCNQGRPARQKRKADDRKWRRALAKEHKKKAESHQQEMARMAALEEECGRSEIGSSGLDSRIAFALFCYGVDSKERFREAFVVDGVLNLERLGSLGTLTAYDYPEILRWVNGV